MDTIRDMETNLILIGARGKRIVIFREGIEFVVVALDRGDSEALLEGRPRIRARRVAEAISSAREAIETVKP